jgi:hypothetical protein
MINTGASAGAAGEQSQAVGVGMTQGTAAKKRKSAAGVKTKEEKFAEKEEDLNGIGYF